MEAPFNFETAFGMNYLVPFDFTTVSDHALKLALQLSLPQQASIVLLHLTKKESEVQEAKERLLKLIGQQSEEAQKLLQAKVVVGNIFKEISTVVIESIRSRRA